MASDLGSVPSIIAMERRTDGYHTVAGGNIESYDVTNATNGIVLNEVGCTQTYVIPKEPKDILFGYGYTQSATGTNADKPIFLGKTTDTANGYLVLGALNAAYGRGIYTVSSAKFPLCCFACNSSSLMAARQKSWVLLTASATSKS